MRNRLRSYEQTTRWIAILNNTSSPVVCNWSCEIETSTRPRGQRENANPVVRVDRCAELRFDRRQARADVRPQAAGIGGNMAGLHVHDEVVGVDRIAAQQRADLHELPHPHAGSRFGVIAAFLIAACRRGEPDADELAMDTLIE